MLRSGRTACRHDRPAGRTELTTGPARGPGAADLGRRVYEKANCVGCHKWHGGGGGGYGGAALSLRETALERASLIEVIRCGRPATRMPYHDRNAYKGAECYGGMTKADLGADFPPKAATFLRAQEIEAVADYVVRRSSRARARRPTTTASRSGARQPRVRGDALSLLRRDHGDRHQRTFEVYADFGDHYALGRREPRIRYAMLKRGRERPCSSRAAGVPNR